MARSLPPNPSSGLKRTTPILLGYRDADIDDKAAARVDFMTSKIGGLTNLPPCWSGALLEDEVRCGVCGTPSVLVSQVYAPLEASVYHRTLYVFACLQPTCWNNSSSWTCLRIQTPETPSTVTKTSTIPTTTTTTPAKTDWFQDEDDWGDEEDLPPEDDEEEQNGNFEKPLRPPLPNKNLNQLTLDRLSLSDNVQPESPSPDITAGDSEDLSSSDVSQGDSNANVEGSVRGAAAAACSSDLGQQAGTAEIEKDQDGIDIIAIDTPNLQCNTDIPRLFARERNNLPVLASSSSGSRLEFQSFYLAVDEERFEGAATLTEHERQLLLEYKAKESIGLVEAAADAQGQGRGKAGGGGDADGYERVVPRHGDAWFHKFMSVMQENPGQLLRYSRDSGHSPLFPAKPPSNSRLPSRCDHCSSALTCELQLLPSLVANLRLRDLPLELSPIEFGTVLVFTCWKSCWRDDGDRFRTEKVWVQAETM